MHDPDLLARINRLTQQIGLLERKVDFLMAHTNARFVDERPQPNQYEQLILAGDRLGAVKLYIQVCGVSMLEAKRAIDEMAARLGV